MFECIMVAYTRKVTRKIFSRICPYFTNCPRTGTVLVNLWQTRKHFYLNIQSFPIRSSIVVWHKMSERKDQWGDKLWKDHNTDKQQIYENILDFVISLIDYYINNKCRQGNFFKNATMETHLKCSLHFGAISYTSH